MDTETGVPVTPNPDNPAFMISSANPESELAFPKQGAFNRSMDERTVEILKVCSRPGSGGCSERFADIGHIPIPVTDYNLAGTVAHP